MLDLFSVSSSDINLQAISWNYSFDISFKFNYRLSRLKYTVLIYVFPYQKITQK